MRRPWALSPDRRGEGEGHGGEGRARADAGCGGSSPAPREAGCWCVHPGGARPEVTAPVGCRPGETPRGFREMHRLLLASLLLSGDEWTSRTLRPGHGEPSTEGFPAARRVRLQVVDAENRGVPGVRVTASWLRSLPARYHGNPDQIPLVTGSEGRITYDGLPATGVVFRVNESAWAPAWLRVDASASSEREVRLRLAPAAPLEALEALEGRAIGTQRARDHLDRHLAADA